MRGAGTLRRPATTPGTASFHERGLAGPGDRSRLSTVIHKEIPRFAPLLPPGLMGDGGCTGASFRLDGGPFATNATWCQRTYLIKTLPAVAGVSRGGTRSGIGASRATAAPCDSGPPTRMGAVLGFAGQDRPPTLAPWSRCR